MRLAIESTVPRRHPLPRLWLMTDERQGDALWVALKRLPRGSGVVVRHYMPDKARRRLIGRIRRIARRRRLALIVAGPEKPAVRARADGFHERSQRIGSRRMLRTVAVHNRRELVAAERVRADLVFVSPVFATESHPGAPSLGRMRFGMLARQARIPIIALGGMTARRAASLRAFGIHGWAAVGALTPED